MRNSVACAVVAVLLFAAAGCAHADYVSTVQGLITRVLGSEFVPHFQLEIISANGGNDVFELDGGGAAGPVVIRGNNAVAISAGLNWYLKYTAGCELSWGVNGTGNQLSLSLPLPAVASSVRNVSPVQWRYTWNVCTVSYSMPWWTWERWEREIDFNALNGVNMPLSFTGQEYIWAKVYEKLGMTEADLDQEFAGAAFLAWGRMGNIRGWGGPLSPHFRNASAVLQKQILARQRDFGMTSVLPCFAGHVPAALKRLFPNANLTRSADWNSFPSQYGMDYLLEPQDPLFKQIGSMFIEILMEEFGTDHWYNCDMYNEMDPASAEPEYLAECSAAVVSAITASDPQGKWLMQGWLFHSLFWADVSRIEAYLSGVSNDQMMILDLNSEASPVFSTTNSYFGKPFIWNLLLDYGGRRGMFGNLSTIATEPLLVEASNYTMVGTGITPEAIENNPIMFNLMLEMGWRDTAFSLEDWVASYAARRYGCTADRPCPIVQEAWDLLRRTIYFEGGLARSLVHQSPALTMLTNTAPNATAVVQAWRMFIQSATNEFGGNLPGPFHYDFVDLTNQMLSNLFTDVHKIFRTEYQGFQFFGLNTTAQVRATGNAMLRMINVTDAVLGTDPNFLVGPWLTAARSWGADSAEADLLEFNARNQITLWGPDGQIDDYAAKAWAGLVGDYYYSRWNLLISECYGCVGQADDAPGCTNRFPSNYSAQLLAMEQTWGQAHNQYPTTASGDLLALAKQIDAMYSGDASNYESFENTDISGGDLFTPGEHTWSVDVAQLMYLCDLDTNCIGFNSNGFLKGVNLTRVASAGTTLYMKLEQ